MYIATFCLSLILGLIAVILLFIGFRSKKHKYESIGGILSALAALIVTSLIEIPLPTIYPLNNDTEIYNNNLDITISSVPFVRIYYSLDGSDPKKGQLYSKPFEITNSTTVSARSRFLYIWSDISKSAYNFDQTVLSLNELNKVEESDADETVNNEVESQDILPIDSNANENQQTVVWNEPIFEKIFTEYFGREDISYSDLDSIKTIRLYGTDFAYINDPRGDIIEGTNTSKFGTFLDDTEMYIYKDNEESEGITYVFGNFISLDDIKYFSNLVDLSITGFDSIDCSVFSEGLMENLHYLALNNCGINNEQVSIICMQNQIQDLALEHGAFNNIEDIGKLTNLQFLNLHNNHNIDDISFLENNINLQRLEIGYTNVTDISPLRNLTNLNYLGVKNCPIQDFSPADFIPEIFK